jgi:hypothetical protein
VGNATAQLDELPQQNASLVAEAAAASRVLADQSQGLTDTMSRYRVAGRRSHDEAVARVKNAVDFYKATAATRRSRNREEARLLAGRRRPDLQRRYLRAVAIRRPRTRMGSAGAVSPL